MQNATFDPSGQYTALISFAVGLVNQYLPFLPVTVQGVVQVVSAIGVFYGIYKAYQAHKTLAKTAGVRGV